jgi:hypothetical protein
MESVFESLLYFIQSAHKYCMTGNAGDMLWDWMTRSC